MKTTQQKKTNKWRCNRCGKKTDTLYFAGKLNICGDCRDDDRRMRRNDGSSGGRGTG